MPNPIPLPPFKAFLASNLPSVFDNTLSYYDELTKLIAYLEHVVVPAVDSNTEALNALSKLVNDLKTYVEDYFKDLDVQEEINNKLDQMAEDGTFDSIFQKYLNQTYYFDTLFAPTTYGGGMQGGCVLPDKTIIQFKGDEGGIIHYATNGDVINSADFNHGHCNSCAYCDETGTIFVPEYTTSAGSLTACTFYEVDPTTLEVVDSHEIDVSTFPSYPYGMCYDKTNKCFMFCNRFSSTLNYANMMWKTDIELNYIEDSLKEYDFNIDSISYFGKFGNYYAIENITNHQLLLFDNNLDFVGTSSIYELTGDTWFNTETEWFDTVDNEVYIGFVAGYSGAPHWGYTYVYGKCDLTNNYKPTVIRSSGNNIEPHGEIYYVDHTTTNVNRNGTQSKPFMNIYEAINSSLRNDGVTGRVRINITTHPLESKVYRLLITKNKTYTITYSGGGSIDFFTGIYVDSDCSLDLAGGNVVLQTPDEKQNPLNTGGACDVQVLGNLYLNTLSNNTATDIVINGQRNAYISMKFDNTKVYDLTRYNGVIYSTSNDLYTKTDMLKGLPSSTNMQNRKICNLMLRYSGLDSYTLPNWSDNMQATIQFTITGEGTTLEQTFPYRIPRYQSIPVSYNGSSAKFVIATDGKVTATDATITRITVQS